MDYILLLCRSPCQASQPGILQASFRSRCLESARSALTKPAAAGQTSGGSLRPAGAAYTFDMRANSVALVMVIGFQLISTQTCPSDSRKGFFPWYRADIPGFSLATSLMHLVLSGWWETCSKKTCTAVMLFRCRARRFPAEAPEQFHKRKSREQPSSCIKPKPVMVNPKSEVFHAAGGDNAAALAQTTLRQAVVMASGFGDTAWWCKDEDRAKVESVDDSCWM